MQSAGGDCPGVDRTVDLVVFGVFSRAAQFCQRSNICVIESTRAPTQSYIIRSSMFVVD